MQTIYLDISNKGVYPCIYAKQSEVGRKFLAVITDGGVAYNIPENSLLSVWYEGDTDAGNYSSIEEKSAFGIDGNKVTVELVAQMLLKPGNGELCLSVTHGDGGETNTWNIPYCVEYKPGAGSSVPTEYYTALTEAGAVAAENATVAREQAEIATEAAGRITNFAEILAPVGYVFQWTPVENSDIDLSTAEKVHDHFGFGTWEQIKDKFLLSAGDTYNIGTNGGAATHTITEAEMPTHRHNGITAGFVSDSSLMRYSNASTPGSGQSAYWGLQNNQTVDSQTAITVPSGQSQPMDIMPPYLAVYTWKRIA